MKNEQQEIEGQAKDLHLKISIDFARSFEGKPSESRAFWCPHSAADGITVRNGQQETIYVRCGGLNRTGLDHMQGEVTECECKNQRGDTFKSSQMRFIAKTIARQPLWRSEESRTLVQNRN